MIIGYLTIYDRMLLLVLLVLYVWFLKSFVLTVFGLVVYIKSRMRALFFLCILGPLVLFTHLSFLFGGEIIYDVELLSDLLRGLALDHGCDLGACQIQQSLNVQIIRRKDDLEQHFLLNVNEAGIPLTDTALLEVGGFEGLLDLLRLLAGMVLAPLYNLLQNGHLNIRQRQRNICVRLTIFNHVLNQNGHACNIHVDLYCLALGGGKGDFASGHLERKLLCYKTIECVVLFVLLN